MNLLFVAVALALLAVALLPLTKKLPTQTALRFAKHDVLFTPAERSFLGVLEQALDSRYRVFGKVRLGDLVRPQKGMMKSNATTARNKLNQKHIDFVICLASDLSVVGAVELDDKSHGRKDRAKRDEFVDLALAGAAIPVIHFPAKNAYALPEIKAKLQEVIKISCAPSGIPSATSVPGVTIPDPAHGEAAVPSSVITERSLPLPQKPAPPAPDLTPTCPKCSSTMVQRQAKKGPHAGKLFWACAAYPSCRQVVPVEEI